MTEADVAIDPVEPSDPLVEWHRAMTARTEMRLLDFEWEDDPLLRSTHAFPKPSHIRWSSTKTGVIYLSTLTGGFLKTRAIAPPSDFSADIWQGYNYMTPTEVLQAIVNRVRDYGHAL